MPGQLHGRAGVVSSTAAPRKESTTNFKARLAICRMPAVGSGAGRDRAGDLRLLGGHKTLDAEGWESACGATVLAGTCPRDSHRVAVLRPGLRYRAGGQSAEVRGPVDDHAVEPLVPVRPRGLLRDRQGRPTGAGVAGARTGVYQNLVFFLAGLCGKQLIEGPTNALAGVGRRTLPIYVIHTPLLALVSCGADQAVVLTAFLAWLCLFLYRYLPKALFELPFGLGGSRSDAAAYRRTTSLTSQ